jgi:hypothetical protein
LYRGGRPCHEFAVVATTNGPLRQTILLLTQALTADLRKADAMFPRP